MVTNNVHHEITQLPAKSQIGANFSMGQTILLFRLCQRNTVTFNSTEDITQFIREIEAKQNTADIVEHGHGEHLVRVQAVHLLGDKFGAGGNTD